MTAFLFIPARSGVGVTRRVDLRNFASLFVEIEEPIAAAGRGVLVARLAALLLVALLVVGDTVLLARPEALIRTPGCAGNPSVARVTSL